MEEILYSTPQYNLPLLLCLSFLAPPDKKERKKIERGFLVPVPTEKEKKGSFFYFASIFLREKTVVRPSLHVCGLFRQDLGAGRRRGEEQQICLSLTPSPQPPSVSELGKRGRDSTTNVFWQMPRPRKPQICWRNPSPPPLPHSLEARETSWEVFSPPLLRTEPTL